MHTAALSYHHTRQKNFAGKENAAMTKALFTAKMMMQMRMCMYMCKLCDAHFPARSPKEAMR